MSWFAKTTNVLREYDWFLITTVFVLVVVSFASIYSIDLSLGENLIYFPTQLIAFGVGGTMLFLIGRVHQITFQGAAKVLYISALVLLVAVLFFGVTIRGTTGWFRVAGFSFQPAEFAKIALIFTLAALVHNQQRRFDKLQFVVLSGLLTLMLVGAIVLQPDLGSALVLGAIWVAFLFLSGVKKRYLMIIFGSVLVVFLLGWFFFFQNYQKDRLRTFVDPARDPLGAGYNVTQSIIAVGSGQKFGRGLGFGSQSQLHFLPEAQTDFIFSVIAEELGFVGTVTVLILYNMLLWRLLIIARRSQEEFGAYVVLGIGSLFLIQIVFNIGAAVGLLPVTGLTLPFLSYGGSSLIVNMSLIGVALSIARTGRDHTKSNLIFG